MGNTCICDWDGGDCCAKTVGGGKVSVKYCKLCKCFDPAVIGSTCEGKCGSPNYKGDGNCDDDNNNCGCEYDGGDCCAKTVEGGTVKKDYCNKDVGCKCLDPEANGPKCEGTCGSPNYKNDGNCD